MATETSTETVESGAEQVPLRVQLIRPLAVCGAAGSILVQYALGIVIVNETIGDTLVEAPAWFQAATASALAIPILATVIAVGLYSVDVWSDGPVDWNQIVMRATAAGTVLVPVAMVGEYML